MKNIKIILVFILASCIALGQNKKSSARAELDSLREITLIPKLKIYDQKIEKFTSLISVTNDKKRIKEYAREIAQVSNMMEDEIATLYDGGYGGYYSRGGVYLGGGFSPWGFYPAFGGFAYPSTYYSNLPPVYYEVDRIKRYANNMRLFTGPHNVSKKLGYIRKEVNLLAGI